MAAVNTAKSSGGSSAQRTVIGGNGLNNAVTAPAGAIISAHVFVMDRLKQTTFATYNRQFVNNGNDERIILDINAPVGSGQVTPPASSGETPVQINYKVTVAIADSYTFWSTPIISDNGR